MKQYREFSGLTRIRITSADPAQAIHRMINMNHTITDIQYKDAFTMDCCVYTKAYSSIKAVLKKHGDRVEIIHTQGLHTWIQKSKHRYILISAIFILLMLTVFLPTRILFVEVQGNATVPKSLILEKAEQCGILFGASRKAVRSEKVKNELIAAIPELQWIGVNTAGCVATIQVEEKSIPEKAENTHKVSSIIADRDGVIQSCTVEQGSALCEVGQAVKKGQILVSAYTDSGLVVTATEAKAEIYALTQRDITVYSPAEYETRTINTEKITRYSLLLGKKLINFRKDSGISDGTCVRMYEEEYITLPGGFSLPVAIVTEHLFYYEMTSEACTADDILSWLQDSSSRYILSQTVAGQIFSSQYSVQTNGAFFTGHGLYSCVEMIGRNITEEKTLNYGKEH